MKNLSVLLLLLAFPLGLRAEEVLDNAAVVRMTAAGLSREVVVLKIERSSARFDVSTDALIALQAAHVAAGVIKAMLLKETASSPRTPAAALAAELAMPTPAFAPLRVDENPGDGTRCATVRYYTLEGQGWNWMPASLCASPREMTIDEQNIALDRVTAHCFAKASFLDFGGSTDTEWWFTDGTDTYRFQGKESDLRPISELVARHHPSSKHGSCGDRQVRALLPRS